jgi:hypothetical protein
MTPTKSKEKKRNLLAPTLGKSINKENIQAETWYSILGKSRRLANLHYIISKLLPRPSLKRSSKLQGSYNQRKNEIWR